MTRMLRTRKTRMWWILLYLAPMTRQARLIRRLTPTQTSTYLGPRTGWTSLHWPLHSPLLLQTVLAGVAEDVDVADHPERGETDPDPALRMVIEPAEVFRY